MRDLSVILNTLLKEKEENAKRANESDYNDYYIGFRDGISFAINAVTNYISKENIPISIDDVKSILDREG